MAPASPGGAVRARSQCAKRGAVKIHKGVPTLGPDGKPLLMKNGCFMGPRMAERHLAKLKAKTTRPIATRAPVAPQPPPPTPEEIARRKEAARQEADAREARYKEEDIMMRSFRTPQQPTPQQPTPTPIYAPVLDLTPEQFEARKQDILQRRREYEQTHSLP
jgi:hypothetical protein